MIIAHYTPDSVRSARPYRADITIADDLIAAQQANPSIPHRIDFACEALPLRLCQAIKHGRVSVEEVTIIIDEYGTEMTIDIWGAMLDPWPDRLMEHTFCLRFDNAGELTI